jgi:hypothetical protein
MTRCDHPDHPHYDVWDRVTSQTTCETVAEIFELEARVAQLEDLRRWRPLSEDPKGDGQIVVRFLHSGNDYQALVWADRVPEYSPRIRDAGKWAYLPGQEPKEDP